MPEIVPIEQLPQPEIPKPEFANPLPPPEIPGLGQETVISLPEHEAGSIHPDIVAITKADNQPDSPSILTIVAPPTDAEQTRTFRTEMNTQRSWSTIFKKIFHRSDAPNNQQDAQGLDSAIGYAEKTNYPETFPYEACYAGPKYWRLVMDLFEKHKVLQPGAHVLEIGSATANLLEEMNTAHPDARLTGVDISASAALKAKIRVPDATIAVGDLNAQGTIDEIFQLQGGNTDVFIALDVIEHMKTPELQHELMVKMYDALKPGGFALIGMPELPGKSDNPFKRWFKTIWNKADVDTTHYNKPTPEGFNALVQNDNVHFNKLEDFGYFPIPAPIGGLMRLGFSANRMMLLQKPTIA